MSGASIDEAPARQRFDWLRTADRVHRRRDLRDLETAINRGQLGQTERPAIEAVLQALVTAGGLTPRERHRVLRARLALADGPEAKGAVFAAYVESCASGSLKSR